MVAYAIQFRRGTVAENASFTGLEGEVVVTTDTNTLVVHDGTTNGGKAVPTFGDLITDVSQLQDSTGVLGTLLSEIHNGTPVEPTVQVSGTAGSTPSVTSTSIASFADTWDDGYSLRHSSYNVGATYDANAYKYSLNGGGDTFAGVVPNANFLAAVSPGNNEGVWFKVKFEDMGGGIMNRKLGGWAFTATDTYASEGSADMLSATELRGDGNSVNNSASDEGGSYGWSTKFNPGAKSSWWSALYFNPTTGYSAHYISHDDTNWSLWADKTFQNPGDVQGIWATVWRRTPGDTASVTLVDVDATVLGLI